LSQIVGQSREMITSNCKSGKRRWITLRADASSSNDRMRWPIIGGGVTRGV